MPNYDYECKSCGHRFEVFQNMSDEPLKVCPKCGRSVRRLIGGGLGVIFKGSGFYVTDNRSSSGSSADRFKTKENGVAAADGAKQSDGAKSGESKTGESKGPTSEKAGNSSADGSGVKAPA